MPNRSLFISSQAEQQLLGRNGDIAGELITTGAYVLIVQHLLVHNGNTKKMQQSEHIYLLILEQYGEQTRK